MALDPASEIARVRQAAQGGAKAGGLPVIAAPADLAMAYALVNRHLFMNRPDLPLPTAFLIDGGGRIVKVYRTTVDPAAIAADAAAIDAATPEARLSRAVPFAGTFHAPLPLRNFLPYGRELMDQGLEAAAVVAFERAAQANPNASTLYRLGTLLAKSGEPAGRGRPTSARSPCNRISPKPSTTSAPSRPRPATSRARSPASGPRSPPRPTTPTPSTTWATRCW